MLERGDRAHSAGRRSEHAARNKGCLSRRARLNFAGLLQDAAFRLQASCFCSLLSICLQQMDRLPLDIFFAIFDLIAPRPRLQVLSLVCKRWRTLCLRHITHLDLKNAAHANLLLFGIVPNLTSLSLSVARPLLLRLPTSLQSLTFAVAIKLDVPVQFDKPPSLTTLSLVFPTKSVGCTHLLSVSQSSLASLSLRLKPRPTAPFIETYLSATHFSRLTSLSLCVRGLTSPTQQSQSLLAFVQRHATQLTSVEWFVEESMLTLLSKVPLPNALNLKWRGSKISPDDTRAMLTQMPRLCSLSVGVLVESLYNIEPAVLLTSLTDISSVTVDLSRLARFPRLRSLSSSLRFSDLNALLILGDTTPFSLISAVTMDVDFQMRQRSSKGDPSIFIDFLRKVTHLTSVTLATSICNFSPDDLKQFHLPCLRTLSLSPSTPLLMSNAVQIVRIFLAQCPLLREVSMHIQQREISDDCPPLGDLMRELDRRGIVVLHLRVAQSPKPLPQSKGAMLTKLAQSLPWTRVVLDLATDRAI